MANNALSESFDSGTGALGNAWNVDTSTKGEVRLHGNSSMMQPASGAGAGQGYGTYTFTAKAEGNQPGPAILLWPGDDKWPGQEIDVMEITPDGSGRHYGNLHWNNNGSDAYSARVYDGVHSGGWHDYQVAWEPGKITFRVDGVEKGVVTEHVPTDHDHGGINNVIGFLNNNPNTSLTVSHVEFTPYGGGASWAPAPSEEASVQTGGSASALLQAQPADPAPAQASGPIDWNALAAQVQANFEATGQWFI